MSLGKKFIDHVFYTPAKSLTDGMRAGAKLGEKMGGSDGAAIAGSLAGALLGAILGGARLLSPRDLAETVMRSDEEIDQRGEDLFKDL